MSIRALLIDDDARLFELLSKYLGQNGVRTTHAKDGYEGLRTLEAGAFDVVVLDVLIKTVRGVGYVLARDGG